MNHTLLDQNIELIERGIELIRSLPDGAYGAVQVPDSLAPPIGPHFRHCLEFYVCFLDGVSLRVVDYGARARRPDLESDPEVAIAALERAAERLASVRADLISERLELRREGDGDDEWIGSTVGRELQFLASHTIHHYALIALSLRLAGHPVPSDFGVAPSTLNHWRREGRAAR